MIHQLPDTLSLQQPEPQQTTRLRDREDIHHLWQQVSKEDLWHEIQSRWGMGDEARVLMLLALHHEDGLLLAEAAAKTGLADAALGQMLGAWESQGLVARSQEAPPRYWIGHEERFLQLMADFFQRVCIEAGHVSTLARWASQ